MIIGKMFQGLLSTDNDADGEHQTGGHFRSSRSWWQSIPRWKSLVLLLLFGILPYVLIFVLFGMISDANKSTTNNNVSNTCLMLSISFLFHNISTSFSQLPQLSLSLGQQIRFLKELLYHSHKPENFKLVQELLFIKILLVSLRNALPI
jgi:hypothetical protein